MRRLILTLALLLFALPLWAQTAVYAANAHATINGVNTFSNTVLNPVALTDTKLAEFTLTVPYLNAINKGVFVFAHVVQSAGTTQTPTVTYKWKLCTVSSCGSGTVLTLVTYGPSGAMTASTTEHSELRAYIVTTVAGASGTVESAGWGIVNVSVGTGAATGGVLWNDVNTAVSSTIALNATVFLDLMGQFSTQSGTKNGMVARLVTLKPVD